MDEIDRTKCYCDPSTAWGKDCNESGCRAYAAIFFIFYLFQFVECSRRCWLMRHNPKSASFISIAQLSIGTGFYTLRHILLLAKVKQLTAMGFFLLFGVGFILSAFLWILVVWCNIIISVNFSKFIQRIFPIVRIVIICLNVAWFIGLTIGVSIYWPYYVTNIWVALYVFLEALGFIFFGYMIWREYNDVSHISAHGKVAEETYKKIKKVTKLSAAAVATSFFVVIFLWAGNYWRPRTDNENVAWLFISRLSIFLWVFSMLICLTPPKKQDESGGKSSAQWSNKMKEMAFSKEDVDDEEAVGGATTPQETPTGDPNKVVSVSQGNSNA
eukprot:gene4521-5636_t